MEWGKMRRQQRPLKIQFKVRAEGKAGTSQPRRGAGRRSEPGRGTSMCRSSEADRAWGVPEQRGAPRAWSRGVQPGWVSRVFPGPPYRAWVLSWVVA